MPKVSQSHRDEMALRIASAAMVCARKKGFAAMSMADIIKEAGLSAGAIYGYYSSKDEILQAIAKRIVGGRSAELDALAARKPVPHPADGIVEFMDSVKSALPDASLLLQVWGMSSTTEAFGTIAKDSFSRLMEHLTIYVAAWYQDSEGLDSAAALKHAQLVAPALIAMVQGWIFRMAVLGEGDQIDGGRGYQDSVKEILRKL